MWHVCCSARSSAKGGIGGKKVNALSSLYSLFHSSFSSSFPRGFSVYFIICVLYCFFFLPEISHSRAFSCSFHFHHPCIFDLAVLFFLFSLCSFVSYFFLLLQALSLTYVFILLLVLFLFIVSLCIFIPVLILLLLFCFNSYLFYH